MRLILVFVIVQNLQLLGVTAIEDKLQEVSLIFLRVLLHCYFAVMCSGIYAYVLACLG